jgi:NAD(P)-dependent dehydrogenase (short-subunit alcohol dehydrogenase family)
VASPLPRLRAWFHDTSFGLETAAVVGSSLSIVANPLVVGDYLTGNRSWRDAFVASVEERRRGPARWERGAMGVLADKVAVITGGTSGIGASIAELFVAEGARVVIAGRREERGEKFAAGLGSDTDFVRTDVAVEADVAGLIRFTLDRWGRLDSFVSCAGDAGAVGGIATLDLGRLQATMAVHLGGVASGMKYAAPVMLDQGSGSIVNVASIGGQLAGWTGLGYSAAKAAVVQLTRCVAVELGPSGIRVNSISPGPILTGIFAKAAGMDPRDAEDTVELLEPVFRARLEMWQPVPRVGVPGDIAPVALWLASDGSAFVNGQNLAVDGGISAGRPASVSAADRAAMANVLVPQAS